MTATGPQLTERVTHSESTATEVTSEGCYVLDLDTGKYYSLGEVGGFIWERLDGSLDLQTIAEAISTEFEVSLSEAGRDLLEFVGYLEQLDLLETGSTS